MFTEKAAQKPICLSPSPSFYTLFIVSILSFSLSFSSPFLLPFAPSKTCSERTSPSSSMALVRRGHDSPLCVLSCSFVHPDLCAGEESVFGARTVEGGSKRPGT